MLMGKLWTSCVERTGRQAGSWKLRTSGLEDRRNLRKVSWAYLCFHTLVNTSFGRKVAFCERKKKKKKKKKLMNLRFFERSPKKEKKKERKEKKRKRECILKT